MTTTTTNTSTITTTSVTTTTEKKTIEEKQIAIFGMGWFWGPEEKFGKINGIVATRVGYAGGTTNNPTYKKIGDHIECIKIEFDPSVITYEKLLELFMKEHDSTSPSQGQYRSCIITKTPKQLEAAKIAKKNELNCKSIIISFEKTTWTDAEDYHQKFYEKQKNN